MSLQAGQILADKYRIVRLLGKGGMGEVYEGENVRIRRRVAIKTLLASVSEKPDVLQRFEREAQAAGRIGSEHIVEVLDMGDLPDGSRFMVMEFCEGSTLSDRIVSRGRVPPVEAARIVSEILEGLAAAHAAGIIHRDLKPANIFLLSTKPNRPDFVKILDFGVSKFSVLGDEMSMTRTGAVVGTPYYMSPEQAKGAKFIDARSDLYSVGVILYETITGQVPFNAETFNELIFKIALESPPPPETFVPNLDPAVAAIIRKSMAREADDRYATPAEFKAALDQWSQAFAHASAHAAAHPHAAHGAQGGYGHGAYAAQAPAYGGYAQAPQVQQPSLGGGTAMMNPPPNRPPAATVVGQAYAPAPTAIGQQVPPMPVIPAGLPAPLQPRVAAPRKSSSLPLIAVGAAVLLLGAGTALLLVTRTPSSAQADTSTATATNAAPTIAPSVAAPPASTAATPVEPPSATPAASASTAPSASVVVNNPPANNPGGGRLPPPQTTPGKPPPVHTSTGPRPITGDL